jgi:hypothetical protein
MEIQSNPDLESLKLVLWCALGVIAVLLVITGYFIKQQINRQVDASKAITVAVDKLKEVVNTIKSQNEVQMPAINKLLDSHSDAIKNIDQRVIKIETRLEIKPQRHNSNRKTNKP